MDLTNPNFPSEIIVIDEKSNNAISQKPSEKSYAARVFQESTIGMLSSIVETHSKYRRFFKIFLLSLCVSGFLYQCILFLNHVFDYPAIVDFAVDRSNTYSIPAYTFCNNNAIRRSLFCNIYPGECIKPNKEFCEKFSSYCGANETLIPKEEYYSVEYLMSYEDILKYGGNPNEYFLLNNYTSSSIYAEEPSGPYLRPYRLSTGAMICYSLHSVVENNQQHAKTKKDEYVVFHDPGELLIFYADETEMMNPASQPGILFSVHSPFQLVNPFHKGIFLKGGRTYKIYVEMQEEVLLKEPFKTNCVDYEELWEKNNHTGPRTQKMCEYKCAMDFSLLAYRCADYAIPYPSKERLCKRIVALSDTVDYVKEKMRLKDCVKNCRSDCRLLKYTTDISVRYQVEDITDENLHRYIVVEIYLPSDGVKILRHSPKYMTVEVFSSIGGFMGCWLGIALMDLLDVFGSIFTVCRYSLKKRL